MFDFFSLIGMNLLNASGNNRKSLMKAQGLLPYKSRVVNRSPQRVGFLRRFDLKTGHTHCPYLSGIGYGFRGKYGNKTYLSFQFQMIKKESDSYANPK